MIFKKTSLDNAYVISLEKKEDERGFFSRMFCKKIFDDFGLNNNIVQINTTLTSRKGTVRGFHFQYPPYSETKIVKCLRGKIFDVIVDIRKSSETFGNWFSIELSSKNRKMIYVPQGFCHGFQTLTEDVELLYFHSEYFHPHSEGGLAYDDKDLNIKWPLPISEISHRDLNHPTLQNIKLY